MYTISDDIQDALIIKNSKFITILRKINNISEINDILNEVKFEYPDATHYTYAYICGNMQKSSDDGEPGGTAGVPMLKVLEKKKLNNIIAIVVRYFGGIKLGANGLVRAYTKSVTQALDKGTICELCKGFNIIITFDYNRVKEIDYLLHDIQINNRVYNAIITYDMNVPEEFLKVLENNNINYQIISEIMISLEKK